MKKIALLGSTGSVGRNVLNVISSSDEDFEVVALVSGGRDQKTLLEQVKAFKPGVVGLAAKDNYENISAQITSDTKVVTGEDEICAIASMPEADIVFIAISGMSGLKPLIASIKSGKTIALASKEPVVSAGSIVHSLKLEYSADIIPVDSEHSALFDCISGISKKHIRKVYITGSGGSLWKRPENSFDGLSVEEVLSHPKWDMGPKITVDSATLMNKALEMIEARWLFDIEMNKIKLVIHPEAVIHALAELGDGTMRACCFAPDMKYPVARALSWPDMPVNNAAGLDLLEIENMSFVKPDLDRFPAINVALKAMADGGTRPAALNAANDQCVGLFLGKKINFTDIVRKVEKVLGRHRNILKPDLSDIFETELWAKEEVLRLC